MSELALGDSHQLIDAIGEAVVLGKSFSVETGADGFLHVEHNGLFHRISHYRDTNYHAECIGRIAEVVARCLEEMPRFPPSEADTYTRAEVAKLFLRKAVPRKCTDSRVMECKSQLLAFRLGITAAVLNDPVNDGFAKFASLPPLPRYLATYNHKLEVDPSSRRILVPQDGHYTYWDDIRDGRTSTNSSSPVSISAEHTVVSGAGPKQPWTYGPDGVQDRDLYQWKELTPFRHEDPQGWNNQYIFEFCACSSEQFRFAGDHTWFRLRTPEGDVYSVGLYRPGKKSWLDHFNGSLEVKKGYLMQPDVSEFWGETIYSLPIAITSEAFQEMKLAIEADKAKDQEIFHIMKGNCTLYAAKIARIAGIELPTSAPAYRMLTPSPLVPVVDAISVKAPESVNVIGRMAGTIFLNFVQLALGSGKVSKKVAKQSPAQAAHICSPLDMFKTSKIHVHHPYILAHEIRNTVMTWREEKVEALVEEKQRRREEKGADVSVADIDHEIARVPFDIPEEFRVAQECAEECVAC